MSSRIEDYALIGNLETAALVGRDGSIDWLGMPRFDSPAFFAALLGTPGARTLAGGAGAAPARVTRRYRGDTIILETTFETDDGCVCLIDFMSRRPGASDLVRIVRGLRGAVPMRTELVVRYDYGSRRAVGGAPARRARATSRRGRTGWHSPRAVPLRGEDMRTVGEFTVAAGAEVSFSLTWSRSYRPSPSAVDAADGAERSGVALERMGRAAARARTLGRGGVPLAADAQGAGALGNRRHRRRRHHVAAGEDRRRAQLGLSLLLAARCHADAAMRCWAPASSTRRGPGATGCCAPRPGSPPTCRSCTAWPASGGSTSTSCARCRATRARAPVRIGNAAAGQLQLDVYGEVLDALYVGRRAGLGADAASWAVECALVDHLAPIWQQPDQGIWEVRGEPPAFHALQGDGLGRVRPGGAIGHRVRPGRTGGALAAGARCDPRARSASAASTRNWARSCSRTARRQLDASLLLIPIVGFLPPDDPRVRGTLAADRARTCCATGWCCATTAAAPTTACRPAKARSWPAASGWPTTTSCRAGWPTRRRCSSGCSRTATTSACWPRNTTRSAGRQLGNFPQAFSHLALVNTAISLVSSAGPAQQRASGSAAGGGAQVIWRRHDAATAPGPSRRRLPR